MGNILKNLIKRNKSNNKGSTLVTVIIAIGLVGILASLILIITQNSYVTKSVDSQSKNNFYSAEEVIDQLKLGIQNEIAASMVDAYYDVIADFKLSDDADDRKKKFKELVLLGDGSTYEGFISKIKLTSNPSLTDAVDPDKLDELISSYYKNLLNDKYRLDVPKNSTAYISYEYDSTNFDTITIRNIGVEYFNKVGYVNGLFTDIVITIPTPDFTLLDPDPNTDYEKFALMARNNVELVQTSNTADVAGSIWIGDNLLLSHDNVHMNVNADNIYVGKDLNIGSGSSGGTYLFTASNGSTTARTNLCAGNITIDNSCSTSNNALKVEANTYVRNDLVFEGNNSTVNLAGTYHGIGISTDTPNESSAIIINGRNNTLNATGLEQISVSGSSFIRTYNNRNYTVPNSDKSILTGDSVSPRSNELAYLVPSQYMKGLPNPVTRDDLAAAGYGTSFGALTTVINNELASSPLKNDGTIVQDASGSYVKVLHYTYSNSADVTTANNMSVAYYYLNFASATKASQFYNNDNPSYVNSATKNMLLGLIPVDMTLDASDFKVVGVNIKKLKVNNSGVQEPPTIDTGGLSAGDSSFVSSFGALYGNIWSFLTPTVPEKLQQIDNDLASGSKFSEKGAIETIIDWSAIAADTNTGCIMHESQLNGVLGNYIHDNVETTIPLKARIYKGNVNFNETEKYYGILISTGDIILNGNVEIHGLVIAGGNIYIRNGSGGNAKLYADSEAVRDIFNRSGLVHTKGGIYLSKILNGFDPKNTAGEDGEVQTISLDNMFTYENWSRN